MPEQPGQLLGYLAGLAPLLARHNHGEVGGEIALALVLGRFQIVQASGGGRPEALLHALLEAAVKKVFQS